jgi:hypothetical protein
MESSSTLQNSLPPSVRLKHLWPIADRIEYATSWHAGQQPVIYTVPPASDQGWRDWLSDRFPSYTAYPPAPHHARAWNWAWSIERGVRPPPHVLILSRGGAKSTTAELIVTALGTRGAAPVRAYCLYICATQEQADDHVANIAAMLEQIDVERLLGKFGNSKGWRRNRLRAANGFTVDALGLDTLRSRGAKIDEHRPGLMVFDDLDNELDSAATTAKKITIITKKLLPAGAADLAVLAVQNLILPDGIFAQLADNRATFLTDRVVDGPHPALTGLDYTTEVDSQGRIQATLTAGEPTWAGQDLMHCQHLVKTIGIAAFLAECQHDLGANRLRIYDCFDPLVHVWPAFEIPATWQRYMGLDFGGVHTAGIKLAEEPVTKRLIIYQEYQAGERTAKEHATELLDGEPMIPYCVGGSKSEDQWRREFRKGGLPLNAPDVGEVEIQISRVWATIKANGLIVLDCCPVTIESLKKYARVPDATGKPTKEIQNKATWHVLDALRYIVSRIRR